MSRWSDGQKSALTVALITTVAVLLCLAALVGVFWFARQVAVVSDPAPPTPHPDDGVLVTAVQPNSPAAQANLQPGHILLRLNNDPITSPEMLILLLENLPAGEAFTLLVRDEAGELRQTTAVRAAAPPYLGVTIAELPLPTANPNITTPNTTATRPLFTDLPVVTGVVPGSPAEAADVQVGDVITAVDNQAILNGEELLNQMAQKAPGDTVTLMLRRGEETLVKTAVLAPNPEDASRGYLGIEFRP
ncbi:MAG: PDZ domain-containing protein [Anaerolineaceae bacterium]|nr:PDZ domain-containing protein [Anaerolineaceae bacterium]